MRCRSARRAQVHGPVRLCFSLSVLLVAVRLSIADVTQAAGTEVVVVQASRTGHTVMDLSQSVQVIDRDQLEQQLVGGASLSETLGKVVPGLGPSSQTLTNFTQTLRGRPPLYLIDGVSLNSVRGISRQLNALHVDQIERIEVISGATAVYGAGASGGIINIVTKSAEGEGLRLSTEVGVAAFTADPKDGDQYAVSQSIGWRSGAFGVRASGSFEQRNSHFDGHGNRISPDAAQISRHDTSTRDLHLRLDWDIASDRSLALSFQDFRDDQDSEYAAYFGGPGLPALFGAEVAARAIKGLQLNDQPYTRRSLVHLDYKQPVPGGHELTAQLFWRTEDFRFFPFPSLLPAIPALSIPATPFVNQSTNEVQVYGLRTTISTALDDWLGPEARLVWGFDWERDENEAYATQYELSDYSASGGLVHTPLNTRFDYSPDVDTTSGALFVQLDWPINDTLSLQAGLRYQDTEAEISDYVPITESVFGLLGVQPSPAVLSGGTIDYDALVFNLGAVVRLDNQQSLFAGFNQGFELPDVARLLRGAQPPGSVPVSTGVAQPASVDDSSLDAIRTDATEFGWRARSSRYEAQVALFYNRSDKTARFDGQLATMLDQDQRVYGVEGNLTYFTEGAFYWGAACSWQRGETRTPGEGWQAVSAWEVSPPKALLYLGWQGPVYSALLQVNRVGDYDDAFDDGSPNAVAIDGYTTLDATARLRLRLGEFGVGVYNLLDAQYVTAYAQQAGEIYGSFTEVPALGRRFGATYRIEY
ncbi:MAG: TonB-dependent receptor [Pseudomonadota bacterium]|nr:TonB-dependent receptor [Pseudomonadota bacterium]